MKYCIIGDEDSVLGFGMVGVQGYAVRNLKEAESAFKEALSDSENGIILIRLQVDRYMFTEQFPLIVEIPDRLGKITGKPDVRSMVNAAIGIQL